MVHAPQLSLLEKTVTFISWALAGVIFLTVGWFALEPDDPLGAVTLLTREGALGVLVQVIALAGITAAVVTVVAGRLLADVGTFATAAGLAAVSLRGETAQALLVRFADASPGYHHALSLRLAGESVGWMIAMLTAVFASALVARWFQTSADTSDDKRTDLRAISVRALAGYDLPKLGGGLHRSMPEQKTVPLDGIKHLALVTVLGLVAVSILSAGWWSRSIQHGQGCFVVAAGVGVACYFGHRIVPVRSALWSILAVGLIAVLAYLWASVQPAKSSLPAVVPPCHFLRILPVQYITVGTAAAVAMFWCMFTPEPEPKSRRRASPHRPSRRGGR